MSTRSCAKKVKARVTNIEYNLRDCPQVGSLFALRSGDMTAKTVIWTIGIALLYVVLLMALGSVLWGIGPWYLESYSD
jgi:hypothetical protein